MPNPTSEETSIEPAAEADSKITATPGPLARRQRELLERMKSLAAERQRLETETDRRYSGDGSAIEREHTNEHDAIKMRFDADMAAEITGSRDANQRIKTETRADYEGTKQSRVDEHDRIVEKAGKNELEARKHLDESVWVTETVFEANERQPEDCLKGKEKVLDARRDELLEIAGNARTLLRKYRQKAPPGPSLADDDVAGVPEPAAADALGATGAPSDAADDAAVENDHANAVERHHADAQEGLAKLRRLHLARLFRGFHLPLLIVLAMAAAGAGTAWRQQWQVNDTLLIVVGSTFAGLVLLSIGAYLIARSQVRSVYRPLGVAVRSGLAACGQCLTAAERIRDREDEALLTQRDDDIATAKAKYEPVLTKISARREHHLNRIEETYPQRLEEIKQRGEQELKDSLRAHEERKKELQRECDDAIASEQAEYERRVEERETTYVTRWAALENTWKTGMAECVAAIAAISEESAALFPDWDDPRWEDWTPPTVFSPSVRFGTLAVDRRAIPGGVPQDDRLAVPGPVQFDLPATLDLPGSCSVLLRSGLEGREQALATLQTIMLRLLTSLPPGKTRFTIIDPVGLGQNFAGFMHLADYEDAFVSGRIWTEARHIEQRLTDLTEHMETVIQKYLRNEFETIAQYNEAAGEIAEPYRFLVISDFPANISETAARRLASVVTSGARCGVYTLISVDDRQACPPGLDMADLEASAAVLRWKNGRYVWDDEQFRDLPLTLEPPPSEDFVTEKLHLVGAASKDATRVEVPFDVIAPAKGACWSRECSKTLSVPLGRSGATKLQPLELGAGTAQHVLIAGKTGSGKSTLLHVLITNLALWYSPDEVEFYLVDFKKGVEFKTYATHGLPHARAVAVESDREFGLSVLQRVDAELRHRGDRFRELGVQDLAGYRRLGLEEPMPRTLLIIDEFQEMFVEDDKLGQDAALLLDRLVRQGRAFGVHVLLGSQTLGGAYTLARSTMGQMQVRIALQCSEADSYLIMSDDNAAARLLSRPGEAIYNDAGGRIEGNSPFQIVWLPDADRERHLQRIAAVASERSYHPRSAPMIVFEGSVPAKIEGNHELTAHLDAASWPDDSELRAPSAWLGEAIAIKGPTAASFRRQSGCNLLMVGQQDESALAMFATALTSLAAQCAPTGGRNSARFVILDGTPVDSPRAGFLEQATAGFPHGVRHVKWRDVEDAIRELGQELDRRREGNQTDDPGIFLVIYGLQRYRMLRTSDDFSFSSMSDEDTPVSAEKIFAEILREGSPLGIHTLVWCDTVTNLTRTLDRSGLREFEMRCLFQMGAADSTQLIDTPVAARLGVRRALFHSEEEGILEKFRPYALPEDAWLREAAVRLEAKR